MNGRGVVKMAATPRGANAHFTDAVKPEKLEHRVSGNFKWTPGQDKSELGLRG
jgi:hypothetical protein